MGEIAEMMLNGEMCEGCGAYLETEGDGIPGYCSEECARDRGADWWLEANGYEKPRPKRVDPGNAGSNKITCPDCGKRVKKKGLSDHRLAKHQTA